MKEQDPRYQCKLQWFERFSQPTRNCWYDNSYNTLFSERDQAHKPAINLNQWMNSNRDKQSAEVGYRKQHLTLIQVQSSYFLDGAQ